MAFQEQTRFYAAKTGLRNSMWITIKGLLSTIAALIVLCAVLAATSAAALGDSHALGWAAIGAYVSLLVAPAAVIIFGVPSVYVLRRTGKRSLRAYIWVGFGISVALALLSAATLPESMARGIVQIFETALILIAGPFAGAVFWISVRPDRSVEAKQASAVY